MDELIKKINKFRDDRNWRHFHNAKDLALSISLEASEKLENFQCKTSEEGLAVNKENIQQELADIFIYSLMLVSDLNLDVTEIIEEKLKINEQKYSMEKVKGTNKNIRSYKNVRVMYKEILLSKKRS